MKFDLHVHTCYSADCSLPLEEIIETCLRKGLDGIAIADHNTISGALALKEIAPFAVIVGEEIDTNQGEILALFLREEIPSGLELREAVAHVKEQGGLVGVPHPLDSIRRSALGWKRTLEIIEGLDFLEGFNSRVLFPSDNHRAQALAEARGLPMTAGSDAHTAYELGRAYVEIPPFDGPEGFLESLAQGSIAGHLTPPWIHLATTWERIRGKLR